MAVRRMGQPKRCGASLPTALHAMAMHKLIAKIQLFFARTFGKRSKICQIRQIKLLAAEPIIAREGLRVCHGIQSIPPGTEPARRAAGPESQVAGATVSLPLFSP